MIGSRKQYDRKTDYIKEFGSKFKSGPAWKVEVSEFVNAKDARGYQTADDTNEDAYPEPVKRQRFVIEHPTESIEEIYYWTIHYLRNELGFPHIDKIYDIFSASESSAMFGNMAQRLSIQQDRAAQFLRGISELVRQLFAIVRELRIIDERLEPYKQWKTSKSADITLKHTYVSLVEQGANNPDSVYSLAAKVGFTVLPDLFFNTHVYNLEKLDGEIEKGQTKEFNKVVKTVLKRKLYQYINWKQKSEKELIARRQFQLRYTRQHWAVIQMYMAWIKPYLKTIQRLTGKSSHMESPELIGAFDTTKLEIEILAKKPLNMAKQDGHYSCVLARFTYTTKPTLTYKPEYQSQAVGHAGQVTVDYRSYGWHDEDIAAYKKMRQEEDFEILRGLDEHIGGAFDLLGEDFEKYLIEAEDDDAIGRDKTKKEQIEKSKNSAQEAHDKHYKFKKWGLLEPFMDMGAGMGELVSAIFTGSQSKKPVVTSNPKARDKDKLKKAGKTASIQAGILYIVYKKAHRYLAW